MEEFQNYQNILNRLVTSLTTLSDAFRDFESVASDQALTGVTNFLSSFITVQRKYQESVQRDVVLPLSDFVNTDIIAAEIANERFSQRYQKYIETVNKNAQLQREKPSAITVQVQAELSAIHADAIDSLYHLNTTLDLCERKKNICVTNALTTFIRNTKEIYNKTIQEIESVSENLSFLEDALPDSIAQIQNFEKSQETQLKTLRGSHTLHWRRVGEKYRPTTSMDYESYLWLKVPGGRSRWVMKYFALQKNKMIAYYKQSEGIGNRWVPEGVIKLLLATVKQTSHSKRGFTFEIIKQDQTWTLQAVDEYTMKTWVNVIQNAISYQLDHHEVGDTKSSQVNVNKLMKMDGNTFCADCGEPHPTWTAMNYGILVCIHCSGVHRQMPYAKVRSLTLDKLDEPMIELLSSLGNKKANQILENGAEDRPINPSTEKSAREAFILQKYLEHKFINQNHPTIDLQQAILDHDFDSVYAAICYGELKETQRRLNPLHTAAVTGDYKIALLIALSVRDLNQLDCKGWGPLSYAAYYKNRKVVEVLLALGCRTEESTDASPYFIALYRGDEDLANLLAPYYPNESNNRTNHEFVPPFDHLKEKDDIIQSTPIMSKRNR